MDVMATPNAKTRAKANTSTLEKILPDRLLTRKCVGLMRQHRLVRQMQGLLSFGRS